MESIRKTILESIRNLIRKNPNHAHNERDLEAMEQELESFVGSFCDLCESLIARIVDSEQGEDVSSQSDACSGIIEVLECGLGVESLLSVGVQADFHQVSISVTTTLGDRVSILDQYGRTAPEKFRLL